MRKHNHYLCVHWCSHLMTIFICSNAYKVPFVAYTQRDEALAEFKRQKGGGVRLAKNPIKRTPPLMYAVLRGDKPVGYITAIHLWVGEGAAYDQGPNPWRRP